MEGFNLGKDFLMGTATAALQIEGGDRNNNWYRWCEQGKIKDGTHCLRGNDHYNRVEEDIALMKAMNNDTYRLGLEWSRIEPAPGQWDSKGLAHYRIELQALLAAGITPLVTLHHFSHPLWFEDMGGWENPKSVEYFLRFTRTVVDNLGDLVSDWITINEPNVYAMGSYLTGEWPPGKKSIPGYFRVLKNMVKAHILAYREIHALRKNRGFQGQTLVGVANHIRVFAPEDNGKARRAARRLDYLFHEIVIRGMAEGKLSFPLGGGGYPLGKGFYMDFFGLNYYSRDIIGFKLANPGLLFAELKTDPELPKNDLGWDIYPQGLYQICKEYYRRYQVPIFITENGICDGDDDQRPQFIYDHLEQVAKLREEGIPVQRYYHWTLMDNFEWAEGESAPFGLIHCDFETQQRTFRKSGILYGELCKNKGHWGRF
jgi:beta-glucosidase